MNDFTRLFSYCQKPALFAPSTAPFWDDEHISRGMLDAHLDPGTDAASRKPEFMDASVEWIENGLGLNKQCTILDLGCGPGLYTSRFAECGFSVTGVDFSKRSIAYAKGEAQKRSLEITYLYQDYLTIDFHNQFDLVTIISCDFAVLSNDQRSVFLRNVWKALKPGGLFLFDVFTPSRYRNYTEGKRNWEAAEQGYWRPHPHICLEISYEYPESEAYLEQYVVMDKNGTDVYRVWDQVYTIEKAKSILCAEGFSDFRFFSDVSGTAYTDDSETLCVIARKVEKGRR